jgi:hypothetical protein
MDGCLEIGGGGWMGPGLVAAPSCPLSHPTPHTPTPPTRPMPTPRPHHHDTTTPNHPTNPTNPQEMFAEVSRLYNDLDQGITPISVFFPNLPIPSHFKRNAARKEMVKLFSKVRACVPCVPCVACLHICGNKKDGKKTQPGAPVVEEFGIGPVDSLDRPVGRLVLFFFLRSPSLLFVCLRKHRRPPSSPNNQPKTTPTTTTTIAPQTR